MQFFKSVILLSSLSFLLSTCASPRFESDPRSTPVVLLSAVVGSLKCGLAKAIWADEGGRTGLLAGVAKVELKVNVVEGKTLKGGLSAGIPIATAGTFTPGFTFSSDGTRTNNSTIKFNMDLSAANLQVCDSEYASGHDGGFSGWIGDVVEDLNNTVSGAPKVAMQSYEYDTDFTLIRKGGTSIDFDIKPVKGNLSYDASRSDIQHINIKIDAVHVIGGRIKIYGAKPFEAIPREVGEYKKNPHKKPSVENGTCKVQVGGEVKPGGKPFSSQKEC